MIQTVLADDELLARQKLRQMLRQQSEIEVVGESSTALETVDLVRMTRPDLLFLDVRMPGKDAFSVIEELSADSAVPMPVIVFTTAYDGYALRAFEIHAVDYLLKPFSSDRLHTAVQRSIQQIHAKQLPVSSQSSEANTGQYAKRIVFKSRGRILFLPVGNIRWIGAEENYVRICTDSESHLLREPIGRMEEKLDPQMFLRVHRSSIVNLQYVKEVRTETGGESVVVLLSGQKLAMSRSYRTRINEWLAKN
jgi:two-component system LytT family response regulator